MPSARRLIQTLRSLFLARRWRSAASGSNRATSFSTSVANCPGVRVSARVRARAEIAAIAAGSVTYRVRSTRTARWLQDTRPSASAVRKPGWSRVMERASSRAWPALYSEVRRAMAISCRRSCSSRPVQEGPSSPSAIRVRIRTRLGQALHLVQRREHPQLVGGVGQRLGVQGVQQHQVERVRGAVHTGDEVELGERAPRRAGRPRRPRSRRARAGSRAAARPRTRAPARG